MIFATGNKHKLREMRELLPGVELEPLPEGVGLPPEEGESFAAIALDKARAAQAATGKAAIADDSGIGAVALGGRPGIHSARYGGEGASDEENLEKLLREVAMAEGGRGAYYVCALALVEADGDEHVFEARCEGRLIARPRGEGGFGYDPAFVPDATGPDDDAHDVGAEPGGEERDQPSRPGGAAAGPAPEREWGVGGTMIRTKSGAAALSIASNSILIAIKLAAGAITGSIAILTEAVHSTDRPDRLGHRLRLGPQSGRAGRCRAPLRPREGREPGGGDRGDADPGRRRDHRLRGDPPAGRRRRASTCSASGSP